MLLEVTLLAVPLCLIIYYWCMTFRYDTGKARREAFPILNGKTSHPVPQVCWHPALKITEQPSGIVDVTSIEEELHTESNFYITKEGSTKIFYRSYRPKKIKDVTHAVVRFLGYGDHCDYMAYQTALTLSTLNNAWVFTFDYPGQGRSDGLWGYLGDWNLLIRQSAEVIENVFLPQIKVLGKPMFCFGISQGGAVAIHLCMLRPNLFKGAVLLAPMCGISDEMMPSPWVVKAFVLISWLAGVLPIAPARDSSKLVWKSEDVYNSIICGPYRNHLRYPGKPRLATAREFLYAGAEITRRAVTEMLTPFFIIHGDSDYVCPIEKSMELYRKSVVEDKTFKEIPGDLHGILENDIERKYDLIFKWINARID